MFINIEIDRWIDKRMENMCIIFFSYTMRIKANIHDFHLIVTALPFLAIYFDMSSCYILLPDVYPQS